MIGTAKLADDQLHTPFRSQTPRGWAPREAVESGLLQTVPGGSISTYPHGTTQWIGGALPPDRGALRITPRGVALALSGDDDIRNIHRWPDEALLMLDGVEDDQIDPEQVKKAAAEMKRRTRDLWSDERGEAAEAVLEAVLRGAAWQIERSRAEVADFKDRYHDRVVEILERLERDIGEPYEGKRPEISTTQARRMVDAGEQLEHLAEAALREAKTLRRVAAGLEVGLSIEGRARGDDQDLLRF
jgi:hypothetical protein